MTILLTTHYLDEAERLCDRVAIIHAGQIVALDTPAALVAGLGDELVELRVRRRRRRLRSPRCARSGIAGDDAFTVGSTLTVPVHDRTRGRGASAAIHGAGLRHQLHHAPAGRRSTTSTSSSPATRFAEAA